MAVMVMRSAGVQYRARRRRFFERKARAERWREAIDPAPNTNSVHVMKEIDQQEKTVRKLIYEYGVVAVAQCFNEGLRGKELSAALREWRKHRQSEWLNMNY